MQDKSIRHHISELVDEEHQLRKAVVAGKLDSGDEQVRLRHIEEELDQCWDLLRQRGAAREFDTDPDAAKARPVEEVEKYWQ
jgi:hypothetical protein